jgi:phenylacetate-coenzyme A ligase PaaK-like adenylate-forming protein
MMMMEYPGEIFHVRPGDFEPLALSVFRYQSEYNPLYSRFVDLLGIDRDSVEILGQVPFMPVEFFRRHRVVTGQGKPEVVFTSSGTTGTVRSNHYLLSSRLYEESFMRTFRLFYGEPSGYIIFALLPSYLEREGSSLVYMADRLIKETDHSLSGFFLYDQHELKEAIVRALKTGRRLLLLGVTHALLDLAEREHPDLSRVVVMETGGMKGMRREPVREELHAILRRAFGTDSIHSEYGMTELLSQAYSDGSGVFRCPPWMRVMAGDINDPLAVTDMPGSSGTANIIDLANFWSCSFIATQDLCRIGSDGSFEITGRYDNSDIRGCNLLTLE